MTLTNEAEPFVVCQATQHGMLIPWGRFARHLRLSERLRTAVPPRHHKDAQSGGDLILEFGLASLAGCAYLEELNLGAHPLVKDQAVQDAWDVQFRIPLSAVTCTISTQRQQPRSRLNWKRLCCRTFARRPMRCCVIRST